MRSRTHATPQRKPTIPQFAWPWATSAIAESPVDPVARFPTVPAQSRRFAG